MSGTVADKATAFRHELTGSSTNKIVCKASNHDLAGPKKKHVDYLINLTNDPHCSMVSLADLLFERLKNTSWVVVFKNLVTTHNLMTLGNERFLQCVATRANSFAVDSFSDKTDALANDMSLFIRRYGKYLSCVCTSYKTLATDLCRLPKGEETPLRTMDPAKLLKTTTVIQQQMDLMMEVEISSVDLTNGVINTAFLMLYKDLIKLYAVYNDALINILEKFFEMKKPQCKEAMALYRKFITRQEAVHKFLQLAEDVGVDKQSHLNLRQVPEDLLPALESHLSEMESIKKATNAQPSPQIKAASEKLAQLHTSTLASSSSQEDKSSSSFANAASPSGMPTASSDVLEAQRKRFEELKRQARSSSSTDGSPAKDTTSKEDILFDQIATSSAAKTTGLEELAGLQGFSSSVAAPPSTTSVSSNPFQVDSFSSPNSAWTQNTPSGYQEVDLFSEIRGKPQPDFDSVFGSSGVPVTSSAPAVQDIPAKPLMGGDLLTPVAVGVHANMQRSQSPLHDPGLTSDVDSSLVRAAENLSLTLGDKTGVTKKPDHQWRPPAPSVKTGGQNFMKMQLQPKTLQPQQPPTSQTQGGQPANWSGGLQSGHFPLQPTMMQPQPQPSVVGGGGVMWQQQQPPPGQFSMGQPLQQQHQDLFGNTRPSLF